MIHILRDGQQFGPYSLQEVNAFLADGSLLSTDLAWYEGAPEWIPITDVPGVLPQAAPVAAAGVSVKQKKIFIGIAAGILVFGAVAFAGMHFLGGDKEAHPTPDNSPSSPQNPENMNAKTPASSGGVIAFANVEGIFRKYRCMECHNSKESNKVEADLDFSFPATTRAFTAPNQPGNPATAPLVLAITPGAGRPMPPNGPMISKEEVQAIMDWIGAGAKF